jgi:hypothetical protein
MCANFLSSKTLGIVSPVPAFPQGRPYAEKGWAGPDLGCVECHSGSDSSVSHAVTPLRAIFSRPPGELPCSSTTIATRRLAWPSRRPSTILTSSTNEEPFGARPLQEDSGALAITPTGNDGFSSACLSRFHKSWMMATSRLLFIRSFPVNGLPFLAVAPFAAWLRSKILTSWFPTRLTCGWIRQLVFQLHSTKAGVHLLQLARWSFDHVYSGSLASGG